VPSAHSDDVLARIDAALAAGVVSADLGVSVDAMRWTAGPVTIRCPEPVVAVDPALAAEAHIDVPVVLSVDAFNRCVAGDRRDSPGLLPDEVGRLRDLLSAYRVAGGPGAGERVTFTHFRLTGPGADFEPVNMVAVRSDVGVTIRRAP
jgi:hypothetical protein